MTSSTAIPLPALLSELAAKQWRRLLERADAQQQALFLSHQPMLLRLLALSDFVAESFIYSPAMLAELLTSERYLQAERSAAYPALLQTALQHVDSEDSLKRVIVAPLARGTGLGHQMMAQTLRQIEEIWPETPVFLSAQAHLQGYYGRYGFVVSGEEYLEDDIPHIGMRRA